MAVLTACLQQEGLQEVIESWSDVVYQFFQLETRLTFWHLTAVVISAIVSHTVFGGTSQGRGAPVNVEIVLW